MNAVGQERDCDADRLAGQVRERLGVLPNFFRQAPGTGPLLAGLWAFTQAAYLDCPLPSLFKERLFVHLSRFCEVRYCVIRHGPVRWPVYKIVLPVKEYTDDHDR